MDPSQGAAELATGWQLADATSVPAVRRGCALHMAAGWALRLPASYPLQPINRCASLWPPASERSAASLIQTWLAYIRKQGEASRGGRCRILVLGEAIPPPGA